MKNRFFRSIELLETNEISIFRCAKTSLTSAFGDEDGFLLQIKVDFGLLCLNYIELMTFNHPNLIYIYQGMCI